MNGRTCALTFSLMAAGFGGDSSVSALESGTWEGFGLDGYDVLNIEQQGGYLYAAVYPSPLGLENFGHGVWRRHEHPDSSWVQLGLDGLGIRGIWVNPNDPMLIYATVLDTIWYPQANGKLLFHTSDGGATWLPVEPGPNARGSEDIVGAPSDPTRMLLSAYEGGSDSVVWSSTDGGFAWNSIEQPAGGLEYSPLDSHTIWTSVTTGFFEALIFRSTDDGQSWEEKFYDCCRGVGPVAISPTGRIFAATGGGVVHSDDDGDTWSDHDIPGQSFWSVDVSSGSPNLVMTAEYPTRGSIWMSEDAGVTWNDISAGVPVSLTYPEVHASQSEAGVFYVAVGGVDASHTEAGVWRYETDSVVSTPVAGLPMAERPQLSVHTNPASGSVEFILGGRDADQRGPLRIFDVLARSIAELDAWQPAEHGLRLIWDGESFSGATVVSGVYYGVIETTNGRVSTRFVWVK